MGDLMLVLISIASSLGALTALGFAFRHHVQLLSHEQQHPPKIERAE